ncbi:MAG: hypothetical protein GPOALKHO_000537 [Sodalis sp.]|nr:MAG: hypothetical protein GPOALKHO_000537 [Sodalis sp.]
MLYLGLSRFTYDEGMTALISSPPSRYGPAASAKYVWRSANGHGMRCGATSKRSVRCIWKSSIIAKNGCWICPRWSKSISPGRGKCLGCCTGSEQRWPRPGFRAAPSCAGGRAGAGDDCPVLPIPTILLQAQAAARLHFIQPRRLCCRATWPVLQFFPFPRLYDGDEERLVLADKRSNIGIARLSLRQAQSVLLAISSVSIIDVCPEQSGSCDRRIRAPIWSRCCSSW